MKNLLLLAALGALGYFLLFGEERTGFSCEREPTPVPAPSKSAVASEASGAPSEMEIVDSISLMRVDRLFKEWKRRNAGTQKKQYGVATIDMADEIASIRFRGPYTRNGIQKALAAALVSECDVQSGESRQIAAGIMSEAERDGRIGGHNRSN
jgi:hypothetical protein